MMRKILAGGTFLMLALGVVSNATAQLQLKGSDTLEGVARDVVTACGLTASITYVGGGSGAGENAMKGATPTQQVAPMSRELNSGVAGDECIASATQLLIALDGLAVIGANQTDGDSDDQTASATDNCSDNITGGKVLNVPGCTANDGCDASANYTFTDWKDVLALVYGGQNHNTAQAALVSGLHNAARVNCANPVRIALVNSWTTLFSDVSPTNSCRGSACTRLKHAFRRDDLSGTTDTFVTLVGLHNIPNPTTGFIAGQGPIPDAASTANPFCNAGNAKMGKGDSDYLDLDPIRRPADTGPAPTRSGLEQVAAGFGIPTNTDANCPLAPGLGDHSLANNQGVLPDPGQPGSEAALVADLQARKCLGLVLSITMPANFTTPQQAYGANAGGATVLCTAGQFAPAIADPQHSATSLCPDGSHQPCLLPVNTDGPTPNFNCLSNPLPAAVPIRDNRVFNLHPVNGNGQYLRDNYLNTSIPTGSVSAARQARIVSAFYRLHTSQVTNIGGSVPTGGPCQTFSATTQIGCLVKASACSIGFAGREGVTSPPADNMAFRIAGITPSTSNVQALVLGGSAYPLARKLWFNSIKGFGAVTGAESTLTGCFQNAALVDPIVATHNFVQVPASVTRLRGCPGGP